MACRFNRSNDRLGHMINNLVNNMWITVRAIILLSLVAQLTEAVIQPPRIYPLTYDSTWDDKIFLSDARSLPSGSEVPYMLTINEGASKSVPLNSNSILTINLNRPIPEDISVTLSVHSGPTLISFETEPKQAGQTSFDKSLTNYTIKYAANTFGDRLVQFYTSSLPGHALIVCKIVKQPKEVNITVDDTTAYISVDIYRDWNLNIIIQIVGWIYFFAWSISFYFQFLLNYQRKSVVGLNFDFVALNLLGFTCYSIYNMSLLFSHQVQQEYYKRYTFSRIPVEYNDLFFALHAVAITILTVIQCLIYERGEQQVSLPAAIFLGLSTALGGGLFVATLAGSLTILDVVCYLSYVKLIITIIKYIPQAYMNYKRKATTGWSIHNIILDFTGGSFSFMQMILIAYNYNDWISIFGNFAKFGLGLISMLFDLMFFIQHYVLYRDQQPLVSDNDLEDSSDLGPSPVISESIRSANTTQQQQQKRQHARNDDSDDNDTTERED